MRPFDLIETENGVDLRFNWNNKTCSIAVEDTHLSSVCDNRVDNFRFYQFSSLLNKAIHKCLDGYTPKRIGKFAKIPDKHWENFSKCKYPRTMSARQQKLLSKAFKPMWENLLKKANPDIVALDKALMKAKGPKANLHDFLNLYNKVRNDKWILQDAIKYIPAILFYLNSTNFSNWRAYYAGGNKPTKALNQTLDAIKYPLPWYFLDGIREIDIQRPLLKRVELITVLQAKDYPRVLPFIFKSNDKEIKVSVKQAGKLRESKVDLRKIHNSIECYYLDDYLRHEAYNGTFSGLVKRSYEWHQRMERDVEHARRIRQAQKEKDQAELLLKENKLPEFELSDLDERIKFLSTVKDLHNESEKMHHCVSGYSERTTIGKSYIFHIDYKDEMATVELDRHYNIVQCKGIKNKQNIATLWAEQYFKNFVRKWREDNGRSYSAFEPADW